MFELLLRLYKEGRLNEQGLDNAIKNTWITENQKLEIIQS